MFKAAEGRGSIKASAVVSVHTNVKRPVFPGVSLHSNTLHGLIVPKALRRSSSQVGATRLVDMVGRLQQ